MGGVALVHTSQHVPTLVVALRRGEGLGRAREGRDIVPAEEAHRPPARRGRNGASRGPDLPRDRPSDTAIHYVLCDGDAREYDELPSPSCAHRRTPQGRREMLQGRGGAQETPQGRHRDAGTWRGWVDDRGEFGHCLARRVDISVRDSGTDTDPGRCRANVCVYFHYYLFLVTNKAVHDAC